MLQIRRKKVLYFETVHFGENYSNLYYKIFLMAGRRGKNEACPALLIIR